MACFGLHIPPWSSSARRSTATVRVAFPANWRTASSAETSCTPSCTMAPSYVSCPNAPWRCSTRQSVRGFARCRNASGLCRAASSASARLQNAHRGSCRSRPSSVSVVLFASKAAVPCVAARAGEAQRVARQRLAAHAATQGTRARWCRMWCCLHTLVQDVVLPSLARAYVVCYSLVQDLVLPSLARAYVVCYSCLQRAIKEHHRIHRTESPRKGLERQASSAKRARVDSQGGSASGVFDMYSVHMQQLTPVHTWNVCTDVPCSGEGETRCELYPCVNALYPHKTEVRRVMWLQDADDAAEGVFAR